MLDVDENNHRNDTRHICIMESRSLKYVYIYLCMLIDFYTDFYTLIYETSVHCHTISKLKV